MTDRDYFGRGQKSQKGQEITPRRVPLLPDPFGGKSDFEIEALPVQQRHERRQQDSSLSAGGELMRWMLFLVNVCVMFAGIAGAIFIHIEGSKISDVCLQCKILVPILLGTAVAISAIGLLGACGTALRNTCIIFMYNFLQLLMCCLYLAWIAVCVLMHTHMLDKFLHNSYETLRERNSTAICEMERDFKCTGWDVKCTYEDSAKSPAAMTAAPTPANATSAPTGVPQPEVSNAATENTRNAFVASAAGTQGHRMHATNHKHHHHHKAEEEEEEEQEAEPATGDDMNEDAADEPAPQPMEVAAPDAEQPVADDDNRAPETTNLSTPSDSGVVAAPSPVPEVVPAVAAPVVNTAPVAQVPAEVATETNATKPPQVINASTPAPQVSQPSAVDISTGAPVVTTPEPKTPSATAPAAPEKCMHCPLTHPDGGHHDTLCKTVVVEDVRKYFTILLLVGVVGSVGTILSMIIAWKIRK